MTNETYLRVSYFLICASGVVFAVIVSIVLMRQLRQATAYETLKRGCSLMRRIFPSWLILAALLAFMSVSYFDCSHNTYQEVINDKSHLVSVTREQISRILSWLAVALYFYGLLLVLFLWAVVRNIRQKQNDVK